VHDLILRLFIPFSGEENALLMKELEALKQENAESKKLKSDEFK
jgi:Tfp pilus assembly protein PilN